MAMAWLSGLLAVIAPRRAGAIWQGVALWRAWVVAAVNILLVVPWFLLFLTIWNAWDTNALHLNLAGGWVRHPDAELMRVLRQTVADFWQLISFDVITTISSITSSVGVVTVLLAMGFFVLLPFAARPGSNRACVRHVLRAVLLGTGFIHFWMFLLTATFAALIVGSVTPGIEQWMPPVFGVFSAMLLWSLVAMVKIVRGDYRTPADLPGAKVLQCDECGYDLHMTDPAGRCPECGKPVAKSIEQQYRLPTEWEVDPRVGRVGVVLAQVRDVVFCPRDLFRRMPTGTGQEAAQRWLICSMIVISAIVFWTVPALALLNIVDRTGSYILSLLVGGVALAVVWAILGLMMVGIETAGVAAVAHFRGQQVPLSSSAKVCCYSSILMVVWAVLGGLQIFLMAMSYQCKWFPAASRAEQIAMVVSLSIAHIGGLLWFEWTVYRGLRAIQYANH